MRNPGFIILLNNWVVPRTLLTLFALLILLGLPIWAQESETPSSSSGRVVFSYGAGYTHYEAAELNEAMRLLAKKTADSSAGFNNYSVGTFSGHPYQVFEIGYERDWWKISLEMDYWVEDFQQEDVAFYTDRDRDPDITSDQKLNCELLRDPDFTTEQTSITGCLKAYEEFAFLPITLNFSYKWSPWSKLNITPTYGIGVMGGSTSLTVETDYIYGRSVGDTLSFEIWPGVNLLQKLTLDVEYRPFDYFGMSLRTGYRWNELKYLEVRHKKGNSEIFNIALGEIEEGQKFYIQSYPNSTDEDNELAILKEEQFILDSKYYNSIQGDFDGWFIALKLNAYFEI